MPHIPKSKSTQKELRALIRHVREGSISIASSEVNRQKEDAKRRAKSYQDLMIKDFLFDSIFEVINRKRENGTQDMYVLVEELCKDSVMNQIIEDVLTKIQEFDNNTDHAIKINSTHINLNKTVRRNYMLYMIELLVRAEVEKMKNAGIEIAEITSILNLERAKNFEERGKALRIKARAVVRPLYGLPEKEQRVDKLREETRAIMKNIASDLEYIQKEEEQETVESNPKQVGNDSDPDASDR